MATAVIIPKLGNTVETCILVEWKKATGEAVQEGEPICDVETDKAVMEVVSPASGTLLAQFFQPGDDVPVLTTIGAIGQLGEDVNALRPASATAVAPAPVAAPTPAVATAAPPQPAAPVGAISPRAKRLAEREQVDTSGLVGSGPHGRIIERDVLAALAAQPKLSPVARAKVAEGGFAVPAQGSGPGGRVMARDLQPVAAAQPPAAAEAKVAPEDEVEVIPVKGVRKVIAERMLASLQTTAQLTLNASADARSLLEYRQRLKASGEELGLRGVTLNDLLLFAVSRTLPHHPDLNALFDGNSISRYRNVHLAVAVDTPRGLVVPVIRNAHRLSLKEVSQQAKQLAEAAISGRIAPDLLTGGTFTVTNLGALGVESFTPVLNPPQVAILGVGNINLKPVDINGEVQFIPHLGLSLTINHQVVDGAPAARFLQALARALADFALILAL